MPQHAQRRAGAVFLDVFEQKAEFSPTKRLIPSHPQASWCSFLQTFVRFSIACYCLAYRRFIEKHKSYPQLFFGFCSVILNDVR